MQAKDADFKQQLEFKLLEVCILGTSGFADEMMMSGCRLYHWIGSTVDAQPYGLQAL